MTNLENTTSTSGANVLGVMMHRMGLTTMVVSLVLLVAWFFLPGAVLGLAQHVSVNALVGYHFPDPRSLREFGAWNVAGLIAVLLPWSGPWIRKRWSTLFNVAPLVVFVAALGGELLAFHKYSSRLDAAVRTLGGPQAAQNTHDGMFTALKMAVSPAVGLWLALAAAIVLTTIGLYRFANASSDGRPRPRRARIIVRPVPRRSAQILTGYLLLTNLGFLILTLVAVHNQGAPLTTQLWVPLVIWMIVQCFAVLKPMRWLLGVLPCRSPALSSQCLRCTHSRYRRHSARHQPRCLPSPIGCSRAAGFRLHTASFLLPHTIRCSPSRALSPGWPSSNRWCSI